MKFDLRPLLFDGAQRGAVVDQERRRVNGVQGHTVCIGVHEFLQLIGVIAGDPARQIEVAGHDAGFDAVLVLKPVRDHFKLQLTNGAQQ